MNILIQFEDDFGTYELFSRYNKGIANCNVTLVRAISSPRILINSRKLDLTVANYIVIVFDLDPIHGKEIIDGKKLKELLRKWMLDKNNSIRPLYRERIVLVPNMYCYETLYSYSNLFKETIENCKFSDKERDHKLISLYKKYYDYSILNPECLFNVENKVEEIRKKAGTLKDISGGWTVQKFHQAYVEQILRSLYRNVSYNKDLNKIFIKKEDRLFDAIDRLEPNHTSKELIDSMIDGMGKYAIHNRRLYNLLTATDVSDISSMIITNQSLKELCNELDEYQASIQGLRRDICDIVDTLSIDADNIFSKLKI